MARYWTALQTLNQVAAELGLPQAVTIADADSVQAVQLLAMLNSAGNEMVTYYPWENLKKEWTFDTSDGVGEYELPSDWCYNIDQTQWDRTNHWPLLGPKSPQDPPDLGGPAAAGLDLDVEVPHGENLPQRHSAGFARNPIDD